MTELKSPTPNMCTTHKNTKAMTTQLQTSCAPNTDAVQSAVTYTVYVQLMTGATRTQIPCDIDIKCSGMMIPVD